MAEEKYEKKLEALRQAFNVAFDKHVKTLHYLPVKSRESFKSTLIQIGTAKQISEYLCHNYDAGHVVKEIFMTRDCTRLKLEILCLVPYSKLFGFAKEMEDNAYILIYAMQRRLLSVPEYVIFMVEHNLNNQILVIESILGNVHYKGIIHDYLTMSNEEDNGILQNHNYGYELYDVVEYRMLQIKPA